MASLIRYIGNYNTVDGPSTIVFDLSERICVQNKAQDMNGNLFMMIRRVNKWKELVIHILRTCRSKFVSKSYSSSQRLKQKILYIKY